MIKKMVAIIISTVLVMTMMPSMVFADTLEEEKVGAGESYGIYIGGTEITSANKDDITGTGIEGKVSYDDDVLTLNNATITGKTRVGDNYTGIDYGLISNDDLTVELIGTNKISQNIIARNNEIDFVGTGSLTVTSPGGDFIESCTAIRCSDLYVGPGTTLNVTNIKRNSVYGVQVNQLAVEGSLTVTSPAFNNSAAICFSDSACDIYVTKTGAIKAESSVNSSTATIAGQSAIAINAGSNGSVNSLGKLTLTTKGGKSSNGIRAKTVTLVDGSKTEVNSATAAMSSGTIKYGDHITFIAGSSSKSAYATAANSVFNQKYFKAGNNIGGSVMPTTLKSLSKAKKAMTVKWNKKSSYFVKGYQIQYSTSSKFKKAKKVTVKGAGSSSKKITKLKKKKKYYVRIRTYSTVSGKTKYSSWSKSKTVKTK